MTNLDLYKAVYRAMDGDREAKLEVEKQFGVMKTKKALYNAGKLIIEKLTPEEIKGAYKEALRELNEIAKQYDATEARMEEFRGLLSFIIQVIGKKAAIGMMGILEPDVSAWLNCRRVWARKKQVRMFKKIKEAQS